MAGNTLGREQEAPPLKGRIERLRGRELMGWAFDPSAPEENLALTVVIDGEPAAHARADMPRRDLKEAGVGTGAHGFLVDLPERFFDGAAHVVEVEAGSPPRPIKGGGELVFRRPKPQVADKQAKARPAEAQRNIDPSDEPAGIAPPAAGRDGSQGPPAPVLPPVPEDRFPVIPGLPKTAFALLGHDDWLFLCNDSNRTLAQLDGSRRFTDEELDHYAAVFCARRDRFAELDIPYVFAVAPTKEIIYRDLLPPVPIDNSPRPIEQLVTRLRLEHGCEILDLRGPVADSRLSGQAYLRTDTHWTPHGAYHAYFALMKEVAKRVPGADPVPLEHFVFVPQHGYRGDLSDKPKMLYLDGRFIAADPTQFADDRFSETVMRVDREKLATDRCDVPQDYQISATRETIITETDDDTLPRAVVMRDSFAIECMPYLGESFSRAVYLWDANPNFEIIERERPDVVIQMMVERFLVRLPELP